MTSHIDIARKALLAPADIDDNQLAAMLENMSLGSVDYADLYFQQTTHETWNLEDSQIKGGTYSVDKGVGVRAVFGEKTGFAYSDDISAGALNESINVVKSIVAGGQERRVHINPQETNRPPIFAPDNPLSQFDTQRKLSLLYRVDKVARAVDPRVTHVNVLLSASHEVILVVSSEGVMQADVRPLVNINVSVIVESEDRRESARCGGGGRLTYEFCEEQGEAYARDAVRQALLNLSAEHAPAGMMPVVLGPGWPGVLLHEAVGHGLEGDFNRKKLSAYTDQIGQQVTAKGITIIDDGSLPDRRGSLNVDDEGTPTRRNVLVDDGILVGYMQDAMNARLMGMERTGNSRRESYAHIPMPRMTNTFMLAGNHHPQEIIASVEKGLYATNFAGGQVDITSGKFVFSTSEAYLIENGKVTRPVRGATLIGCGPEVMRAVSMVGDDLALDQGIGLCGKDGQSVPVCVGQPTLKIDGMTVGGSSI